MLTPTLPFVPQAVYFLYGTKDCLVQECKDLDKRIEVWRRYNKPTIFICLDGVVASKRAVKYYIPYVFVHTGVGSVLGHKMGTSEH